MAIVEQSYCFDMMAIMRNHPIVFLLFLWVVKPLWNDDFPLDCSPNSKEIEVQKNSQIFFIFQKKLTWSWALSTPLYSVYILRVELFGSFRFWVSSFILFSPFVEWFDKIALALSFLTFHGLLLCDFEKMWLEFQKSKIQW